MPWARNFLINLYQENQDIFHYITTIILLLKSQFINEIVLFLKKLCYIKDGDNYEKTIRNPKYQTK